MSEETAQPQTNQKQEPPEFVCPSVIIQCLSHDCRYHERNDTGCRLKGVEIGVGGICVSYAQHDEASLREYFQRCGLHPAAIEELIRQALQRKE